MSLVSDALKKAQREAAAREARAKGLPEPLTAAGQPYRARRRGGARTLVVAATAALATGAAVAWFLLDRSPAGPGGAGAHAPASTSEVPERGEAGEGPAAAPAAPTPPGADGTATTRTGPATPPSPESGDRSGETSSPGASPAPSPAAPEARPDARTFVREARLDDGVELRLGGIAWSDVAPLAYLNGQLLGVGESVSGWTIERIERDRVRLSGPAGAVFVSLR